MAYTLVAINILAEHFNDTAQRMRDDTHWAARGHNALDYLGLSNTDYTDLRDYLQSL